MKQRLIVRQNGLDGWCVSGEGCHFWCSCEDKSAALFVAHQTRNQWYPRARVVVDTMTPAEERFQRREWRDQMRGDWNE